MATVQRVKWETYQKHESGEEEEPEVVCFAVRERGLFEHTAVTHAVAVVVREKIVQR
jgi:hypothetical protein